jgi:hypothetical protein
MGKAAWAWVRARSQLSTGRITRPRRSSVRPRLARSPDSARLSVRSIAVTRPASRGARYLSCLGGPAQRATVCAWMLTCCRLLSSSRRRSESTGMCSSRQIASSNLGGDAKIQSMGMSTGCLSNAGAQKWLDASSFSMRNLARIRTSAICHLASWTFSLSKWLQGNSGGASGVKCSSPFEKCTRYLD